MQGNRENVPLGTDQTAYLSVEDIRLALQRLHYGALEITIHNGQIVHPPGRARHRLPRVARSGGSHSTRGTAAHRRSRPQGADARAASRGRSGDQACREGQADRHGVRGRRRLRTQIDRQRLSVEAARCAASRRPVFL
ncbi:MAG: DUF2292 domain-containing protein [Gammaproteobacteria bacterium]|nr:DUF2292 domain-containing protein [Gammaproteobacteria bacterium]